MGQTNISAYGLGVVGYRTPNLDKLAREGMMFTDYYAENSCTAGRSTFITGQFGKNHLGDRNEYLPTAHGFDEFFGNLYHLNAEEEPERPYWPKEDVAFTKANSPRGVIHSTADGKVEDTGPLATKRMETIDDETTNVSAIPATCKFFCGWI